MSATGDATPDAGRAVYVISVAAELAGVHPQTLRVYERRGLLDPSRTRGGSRRFSDRDLARLRHIQELTTAGLNLEGVRQVLALEAEVDRLQAELERVRAEAREAIERTMELWHSVRELERDHAVEFQREPDLGFAWAAYRWADGQRLSVVLEEVGLPAGDFVRWCKQLIDMLGQVADAAGTLARSADVSTAAAERSAQIRTTARAAIDLLRRGVVAYSSVG